MPTWFHKTLLYPRQYTRTKNARLKFCLSTIQLQKKQNPIMLQKTLLCCLYRLEKAFDTVNRLKLLSKLAAKTFPHPSITRLLTSYSAAKLF
jgi:hypothetical protein